jgi:hypothetical protein
MIEKTCENCVFWKETQDGFEPSTCRRYPPVTVPNEFVSLQPATASFDCCGEFQPQQDEYNIEEIKREFGDCDWMRTFLNSYTVDRIVWMIKKLSEEGE